MDIANEINEVISTPLVEFDQDDDDLLAELEDLEGEDLVSQATRIDSSQLSTANGDSTLSLEDLGPSVPTNTVSTTTTTTTTSEDAEFAELEDLLGDEAVVL